MSVKRSGTRRVPHPKSPGARQSMTRRILALLAWGPARLRSPAARWAVNVLALAGAALIIISAIIHLHLWASGYRGIAVIGPLFLAQGVISIPFAVVLGVFRRLGLLLEGRDGRRITVGSFRLTGGYGHRGRPEPLPPAAVTGARLTTAGGKALATASFSPRDDGPRGRHAGHLAGSRGAKHASAAPALTRPGG